MRIKKNLFFFIAAFTFFIPTASFAQWLTIQADNGNQVLIGTNSHNQGLALVCIDGDLTIKYLEPDSSTLVSDGQKFSGSLTIDADGNNLTTRNSVFYVRHTPEHAGLIAELKNMEATVRKVLRGLRDSKHQIIISANSYDGNRNPILLKSKGSTAAVKEFAEACQIDI